MIYTIFKPSPKNNGGILKFKTSLNKNEKKGVWQERLFVEQVPQKTWDGPSGSTYNAADKKVVMINITEAGEILHTMKTGIPFQTYHKHGDGGVWIKFGRFMSSRKFGREGDKGYREDKVASYALGIGGHSIPLSPGEAECLRVYLEKYIVSATSLDGKEEAKKFKQGQKQAPKKQEAPVSQEQESSVEDDSDIPF